MDKGHANNTWWDVPDHEIAHNQQIMLAAKAKQRMRHRQSWAVENLKAITDPRGTADTDSRSPGNRPSWKRFGVEPDDQWLWLASWGRSLGPWRSSSRRHEAKWGELWKTFISWWKWASATLRGQDITWGLEGKGDRKPLGLMKETFG